MLITYLFRDKRCGGVQISARRTTQTQAHRQIFVGARKAASELVLAQLWSTLLPTALLSSILLLITYKVSVCPTTSSILLRALSCLQIDNHGPSRQAAAAAMTATLQHSAGQPCQAPPAPAGVLPPAARFAHGTLRTVLLVVEDVGPSV